MPKGSFPLPLQNAQVILTTLYVDVLQIVSSIVSTPESTYTDKSDIKLGLRQLYKLQMPLPLMGGATCLRAVTHRQRGE